MFRVMSLSWACSEVGKNYLEGEHVLFVWYPCGDRLCDMCNDVIHMIFS